MIKRIPLLLLFIGAVALGGCNTVQGLGKDISKAGDKIEEVAKKK
ncbi:MAG: entericidin A/B family lipoprotein [Aquabacterium sp.]